MFLEERISSMLCIESDNPKLCCFKKWSKASHTLISSSSLSQVTSGLGLPRVTQGKTAFESTRRVTLVGWRLICGSERNTEQETEVQHFVSKLSVSGSWLDSSRRTHLQLQCPTAPGWLSDSVVGEAAVLSVVCLSNVRDDEHLSLFPGDVPRVIVPGGGVWLGAVELYIMIQNVISMRCSCLCGLPACKVISNTVLNVTHFLITPYLV